MKQNRFDVVGYVYDHSNYCLVCFQDNDGGDVEVKHVKALFRGGQQSNLYTCATCHEKLITESPGKTFEVAIVYKGQRTYIVEAPDEETASDFALARFMNGERGESTGSEYEETENIAVKELA